MRSLLIIFTVLLLSGSSGQIQVQGPLDSGPVFGTVSIQITSPELGPGLGPKKDVDEEFDLAFDLMVANLTINDLNIHILSWDDNNETYLPFEEDWIVDRENVTWSSIRGPVASSGKFRIRIPERGYYFFRIRGNYTVDDRMEMAEGGDLVYGPRIRVIPGLNDFSYAILFGMPVLPIIVGVLVRTIRRRETKKRRRGPSPEWLERIREKQGES